MNSGTAVQRNGGTLLKRRSRSLLPALLVFALLGVSGPASAPTNPLPASDVLGQRDLSDPAQPAFTKAGPNDGPHDHGFNFPSGVAFDPVQRLLFVADSSNHRVLVFPTDAAGAPLSRRAAVVLGQPDLISNTPATSATGLRSPQGLAVDPGGRRLYVADAGNHRVIVHDTTALANGQAAVAVLGQHSFTEAAVRWDGAPSATTLRSPRDVAVDPGGRLFVADTLDSRVLVFHTADLATTPAGLAAFAVLGQPDFAGHVSGLAASRFAFPQGVGFDPVHNRLAVADASNARVLLFDTHALTPNQAAVNVLGQPDFTSHLTTPTRDRMLYPTAAAFEDTGNRLFALDASGSRALLFAADPAVIHNGELPLLILGQSGPPKFFPPPTAHSLAFPRALTWRGTRLWIADSANHRALAFDDLPFAEGMAATDVLGQTDALGQPTFVKNGPNDGPNALGYGYPGPVALDSLHHRLFVADPGNARVLVYLLDAQNRLQRPQADLVLGQPDLFSRQGGGFPEPIWGTLGADPTDHTFTFPQGLAYDAGADRLYVADGGNNRVLVFDASTLADGMPALAVLGQTSFTSRKFADPTDHTFAFPQALAVEAAAHRLYVAASSNNRVLVFDTSQITAATRGDVPAFAVLGQTSFTARTFPPPSRSTFRFPQGLSLDAGRHRLFVADPSNNRVLIFDTSTIGPGTRGPNAQFVLGQSRFTAGATFPVPPPSATTLLYPRDVAADPLQNRLFVVDGAHHRVVTYELEGLHNGLPASAVLGQPDLVSGVSSPAPTRDRFSFPAAAGLDPDLARVYVTDPLHYRVLLFDLIHLITTALPPANVGQPYSATLGVSGGQGPLTFTLVAGALPAGLSLDPATGAITGTPTTSGTAHLTLRVRDADNFAWTGEVTLAVSGADTTPPAVAITSPAAGAFLNQTSVTVTGTATDASGIASVTVNGVTATLGPGTFTATVPLPTEGANSIAAIATDNSGNSASASVTVTRDTTPPTIACSLAPAPNAAGWNNTNVTVSFTASDAGSGLATTPAPVLVTTEGANQPVSGTATDKAGNAASATCQVSLDKTPPTLTFGTPTPAPNGAGWNNTNVTLPFTPADSLSGVATVTPASPLTLSAEGSAVTGTVTVTDKAGNSATFTSPAVKLDKTPPTVTFGTPSPPPNANGWNNTNVSIPFTVADSLSGIAASTPSPLIVSAEGSGVTGTATVTDVAGNTATATSPAVKIDKTPPTIALTSPAGGTLTNQTSLTVTGTVADANLATVTVNGIAAAVSAGTFTATVPVVEGANSITAIATDNSGNSASASVSVTRDTSPPTLQITAPAPQAVVFGTVAVTATAGDSGTGITSLAVTSPPGLTDTDPAPNLFAAQWDTTALPEGPFTITARAQDAAGNVTTASVDVVIANVGRFAAAPSLPNPRAEHSATLLPDGTVYLFGGHDATGAALDTALRFDPGLGQYAAVPLAPPPAARERHSTAMLPTGQLLVLGGQGAAGVLGSAELHDGAGAVAALSATIGTPRRDHTGTLLTDGTVLIAGGEDASGAPLTAVEVFDPKAGTFSPHPAALTAPRSGHTATLLPDGRILFLGGRTTGGTLLATAEVFDPTANTVAALPAVQLPEGRADHTATLLPTGEVLVAGGRNAAGTVASTLLVSLAPPGVRALAPLAGPRAGHTATLLPGRLVLLVGGESNPVLDTAEQFVPTPADAVAPAVAEVRPPAGATDVPTDARVAVRFTEPLNPRTVTPTAVTLTGPAGAVPGNLAIGEGGLLAFFTPTAPLTFGTTFTVNLGAALLDLAGNALPPFTSTFTVQLGGALALSLNPTTVNVGQGSTLTVTLPVAPPAAGVTVTLANGTPSVATLAASSVTIPQGQQSATVAVTTLGPGTATITGSAAGFSDGSAQLTINLPAPTVSSFNPTSGKVGDSVTVTGTNFFAVSAVACNGVNAPGFTVTGATSITVAVPTGATTGPIAVTNATGTGTSTGSFVVIPTQDFQLSALPNTISVAAAWQGAFNIGLTGSGGYTSLTTLAVTGLPTGATATFTAPTLTAGQNTLLTLLTNGTTPQGSYPLTVTATGLLNGVQTTRSANITLQVQAPGQTLLTGQVFDEDANPLPGVALKLAGPPATVLGTTDAAGNFTFGVSAVGQQVVIIDGSTAPPAGTFPAIAVTVTLQAGQANGLGYTPHLHRNPPTQPLPVAPSTSTPLTFATVPDLQVTIPAGVTITGWDGQPNTQMGARLVPLDRLAIPPPPATVTTNAIYMFTFGKVGGGLPSAPVPVTLPNTTGAPPGTPVHLWFFNEAPDGTAPNAWQEYGLGTVSADGRLIVPNPGVGMPRFCCGGGFGDLNRREAAVATALAQRGQGTPVAPGGTQGGEPVDLATGVFTLAKTDLVLPGRLPVVLTRTYRTSGNPLGPFGSGTSHPYQVVLLVEGTLRTLALPSGVLYAFPPQGDGTFRNVTDPAVRGAVLAPGGPGQVLRFKDGTTWTFGGTASGGGGLGLAFLIAQTDRNGNTLTLTRGGTIGQTVTAITEPGGRQLTLTSDASNQITAITDPLGRTVTYTYGPGGLATVTDPAGGVTTYTYDSQGRMLTITDPRGITYLTNTYDANGRVATQTQADGGVWQFAYTVVAGTVTQTVVTDPRGNPTTYRFNGQGYLLNMTDTLGQTITYTRDPATNLLLATTDPLNRTTRFTYDSNGNVTSITDPAGNVRTFTYEPTFNRVTSVTDPLGHVTGFQYDATNGNLLKTTDPLGNATQIAYNAFGLPVSITNALGNVTQFAYNAAGDLATVTDPLGNTSTREYDQVSRLVRQTDPRGKPTAFDFDTLSRPVSIVDALGGTTAFGYDLNGNLLTVTDARGNTTTHQYDAMERLSQRIDQLGVPETFAYDAAGNLTQARDRKGQATAFAYDGLNRRTLTTYADGTAVTATYDAGGRLTGLVDSNAGSIAWTYDALPRVTGEASPQGSVTYTYDSADRRTTMTVAGESPVTYTYDNAGRPLTITKDALVAAYAYDNLNRRTSLTLPNGVAVLYSHDPASRLSGLIYVGPSGTLGTLTYTYDAAGNRTAMGGSWARTLLADAIATASYDAANRQLTFGGKALTFDANGNLTALVDGGNTTTYTWDTRNQLATLGGPGLSASLGYDAAGRRIQKTIGGQATTFQYDGMEVAREIAGGTAVSYVHGSAIDEVLARIEAGTPAHYLGDTLGSTLALTDGAGAVTTSYTYGPFGATASGGSPSGNAFQYTGRENDGTGLYYYRARYYNPSLSRFISEDPMRLKGGDINFYGYVGNSPTNATDPYGLWYYWEHERLTREEARACGLSGAEADAAARAARRADTTHNEVIIAYYFAGRPDRRHYDVGTNEAADQFIDQQLKLAIEIDQAGTRVAQLGAMQALGTGLHAVQDAWAHAKQIPRGGWRAHVSRGKWQDPDDPRAHPYEWDRARLDTRRYIRDFLKARGVKPKCDLALPGP